MTMKWTKNLPVSERMNEWVSFSLCLFLSPPKAGSNIHFSSPSLMCITFKDKFNRYIPKLVNVGRYKQEFLYFAAKSFFEGNFCWGWEIFCVILMGFTRWDCILYADIYILHAHVSNAQWADEHWTGSLIKISISFEKIYTLEKEIKPVAIAVWNML